MRTQRFGIFFRKRETAPETIRVFDSKASVSINFDHKPVIAKIVTRT